MGHSHQLQPPLDQKEIRSTRQKKNLEPSGSVGSSVSKATLPRLLESVNQPTNKQTVRKRHTTPEPLLVFARSFSYDVRCGACLGPLQISRQGNQPPIHVDCATIFNNLSSRLTCKSCVVSEQSFFYEPGPASVFTAHRSQVRSIVLW